MIVEKKDTKPFSFYLSLFPPANRKNEDNQPNNTKKAPEGYTGVFFI
jgi:hypothetical protein